MFAKRMSQVIIPDDVLEDTPPTLKARIDQLAMAWYIVHTILPIAGIQLFSFATVQNKIKIDQAHISKGGFCARCHECVKSSGMLRRGYPCLEQSDTPRRKFIANSDYCLIRLALHSYSF